MKRKRMIIAASGFIIIMLLGFFLYPRIKYYDNWEQFNYGQTVENLKGENGVDINYPFIPIKRETKENVVVAIVDTGIYNGEKSPYYKALLQGWDFYNQNESTFDKYLYDYHGTYIANQIYKLNPSCNIVPIKFMSGTKGNSKKAIAAIEYAIKRDAKVINCSWCLQEDNEVLRALIESNPDVLFVCAAGNKMTNLDCEKVYPASYNFDNVISVAAIKNDGQLYEFSGYGKDVTIAAPGASVKVSLPENGEILIDGTSIATAIVTGVSSSLLSKYPELSPSQIKELVINTATPVESLEFVCRAGGIVNMKKSIKKGKEMVRNGANT